MELIINWDALNMVSLAFCKLQGLIWIIVISGIIIFKPAKRRG